MRRFDKSITLPVHNVEDVVVKRAFLLQQENMKDLVGIVNEMASEMERMKKDLDNMKGVRNGN